MRYDLKKVVSRIVGKTFLHILLAIKKIIMRSFLVFLNIFLLSLISFNSYTQCLETEDAYKDFYNKNISTLDPIEGVWSVSRSVKLYNLNNELVDSKFDPQAGKDAIIRVGDKFIVCPIEKDNTNSEVLFSKTAISGVYLYQRIFHNTSSIAKADAVISSGGLLEYSYEMPIQEIKRVMGNDRASVVSSLIMEIKMIKLFPSLEDIKKFSPSSGTGFALTNDGIIVTNSHVVNSATNIIARGINGNFSNTYKCRILVEDKNNDLALIKIDDKNFAGFGKIPYTLKATSSDVAENVFALGYPLRAIMGDEIKLTNGIISSKTGFQDDITSYQVSVPIQPGNSGGPLFDKSGNLIGVINAKLRGGENVSYAVKISYLKNLIELLPTIPALNNTNSLSQLSLSSQVKILSKYVYIIETK